MMVTKMSFPDWKYDDHDSDDNVDKWWVWCWWWLMIHWCYAWPHVWEDPLSVIPDIVRLLDGCRPKYSSSSWSAWSAWSSSWSACTYNFIHGMQEGTLCTIIWPCLSFGIIWTQKRHFLFIYNEFCIASYESILTCMITVMMTITAHQQQHQQILIQCISNALTSYQQLFSTLPFQMFLERMQSHTGCTCLDFLQCIMTVMMRMQCISNALTSNQCGRACVVILSYAPQDHHWETNPTVLYSTSMKTHFTTQH